MGQRHYQLKVIFVWILFSDRIDYAKSYVISSKNKPKTLVSIDSAISLGAFKILNSIINEKETNSNNARQTSLVSDILKNMKVFFMVSVKWKM